MYFYSLIVLTRSSSVTYSISGSIYDQFIDVTIISKIDLVFIDINL